MQSELGEKGRYLPWGKEEEGAYIFWMKQVSVRRFEKVENGHIFENWTPIWGLNVD
jgi:hypothetical protein